MAKMTIEGCDDKVKRLRKELKLRLKRDKLVLKDTEVKQTRKRKKDD